MHFSQTIDFEIPPSQIHIAIVLIKLYAKTTGNEKVRKLPPNITDLVLAVWWFLEVYKEHF